VWLLSSIVVFFLLLNFFPNSFTFDRYYSAPRIFRYLAPLSYGLSLFAAKLMLDLGDLVPKRSGLRPIVALAVLLVAGIGIFEAVGPSRSYRARIAAIRQELQATCPPAVVMESWQALFFRSLHLREACPESAVRSPSGIYAGRDYERWLRDLEPTLPNGAKLVTGLVPFVYYACNTCGFRIGQFEAGLDQRWVPLQEFEPLSFDPAHEPIRIWRWTGMPTEQAVTAPPQLGPQQLFDRGIERFDAQDYPGTRAFMLAILARFPAHDLSDDAAYFAAVTHWREQNLPRTIREFRGLIARFPSSRWVSGAHYHIGLSQRSLGQEREARRSFDAAVANSSTGDPEREYALAALDAMVGPPPLASVGRGLTEFVYQFQATVDRWEASFGRTER
jgi:hypothetical protein